MKIIMSMVAASFLLTPAHARIDGSEQIRLYMDHYEKKERLKMNTEAKNVENENTMAKMDALGIKRRGEVEDLKHKRDIQKLNMEIETHKAKLDSLKAREEAKDILDDAKSKQTKVNISKDKLEKEKASFNKEKIIFRKKKAQLAIDIKTYKEEKQAYEERVKSMKSRLKEIDLMTMELDKSIDDNDKLREKMHARIGNIVYSVIYINNGEAMIQYGDVRRLVKEGTDLSGFKVQSITNDGVILKSSDGTLRKISVDSISSK